MRMLLIEWHAWWRDMPSFVAEERLASYTVELLGNPTWEFDRESILTPWRSLAGSLYGAVQHWLSPNESPMVTQEDFKPGALRRNSRRVWRWLRSNFGGGIS